MAKAPDAFRTISEVADWLDTPAHVLRFWESKFTQIKPIKRAGGRRYYRPEDMELLGGIKALLHDQGMTIKGVQKLLREQGVRHVGSFGPAADGDSLPETSPAPAPQVATFAPAAALGSNFTAALAAIPLTPSVRTSPPQPRIMAVLNRAAPRALLRTAPRIRPLLRQLQDLRARMGND